MQKNIENFQKKEEFSKKLEKYGLKSKEFQNSLFDLLNILNNNQNSCYIFHDSDSDGLCSYMLLHTSFQSIKGGHFITKEIDSQEIAISKLDDKITHIIFLDTPSIDSKIVEELSNIYKIIILDHHKLPEKTLKYYSSTPNITYINPLIYNSQDSRPITFFSYILSKKEISHLLLAIVGTISDFYITSIFQDINNFESKQISALCNSFNLKELEEISKNVLKNPLYYQENSDKNRDLIYKFSFSTHVGILKLFFDFIFKNTTKSQEYIHLIQKFSLFELIGEINEGTYSPFYDFKKYKLKYEKILQKEYKKFKENQTAITKDRILIEHKGKTSYNRQLSEQALYDLNIQISCSIHQKFEREFFSGSIRSTSNVNLHTFLKEIFKDVEDVVKWGGHVNACGFQFPEEFKEKFIERFHSTNI
ncbi:MAG: hypothetical protein LAT82_00565 [Nanoarchaeota archaeon]|nr:hypothetical protein [Nanoarchaeota archaeon]